MKAIKKLYLAMIIFFVIVFGTIIYLAMSQGKAHPETQLESSLKSSTDRLTTIGTVISFSSQTG